ncbi:hypothetical protein LRAMOSA03443 [Lichtheimia ramosa]|uniref:MARVEL domain-containing protein n=1 Tax=Lichtheimia ramosa TaxID=688394 RepID=A0A077WV32_9FUNG|nr:hypothetical protein LRAMOSA03443 [Lichtheimia ramosa]
MGQSFNVELPVSVPAGLPQSNTIKSILHILQVLCTFITVCVIASVISTEMKFYGSSQSGPNWTLFVALSSLAVPIGLVVFPWIYDKQGKFRRLGKFCIKSRTNIIFTSFYTVFWATAGIAMSVHSGDPNNCTLFGDMREAYGDEYTNAWPTQCTNAKVAAGFSWTTCFLWLGSLLCTLIIFWKEKQTIQQNIKEHEANKQAVLQMQQRDMNQEDMYDEPVVPGRKGDYAATGYYEEDDMRPQSFEQSRPLHQSPPPPAAHHNPSPYGSPFDQHQEKHDSYGGAHQQQYDPYPEQPYNNHAAAHPSPFDDYYAHHSPEPPVAQQPYTVPSPPQQHNAGSFTPVPMPMPDHTHYSNSASPEMNNSRY